MNTQYIHLTISESWTLFSQGLCPQCGLEHSKEGCRARDCDSCSERWLADTGNDNGEGVPVKETCPACVSARWRTIEETLRKAEERWTITAAEFKAEAELIVARLESRLRERRAER